MIETVEVGKRATLRRLCVVVAAFMSLWAYGIALSGGFVLEAGPIRFSSRSPRNALLLMALASIASVALDQKAGWRQRLTADLAWLFTASAQLMPSVLKRHARPHLLAGATVVLTVYLGIVLGVNGIGGSDSYGYVSQAHLWATGVLKVPQPLLHDLPSDVPQEALVPLGYRLAPDRNSLVPTYAPGLPMVMAVFERFAGMEAVFLVVPLLGGLAVWATYALGKRLIGDLGGSIAAIFLATSPAFLFQLVNPPMSDIAAAAWWSTALVLVLTQGRIAAFGSGLAAGAAILTRPNLVPLAIVIYGVLLIPLRTPSGRSVAVQRLLLFTLPMVLACGTVGYLNMFWYGSPLSSGYGPLAGELFRWGYFWPDVTNYTKWAFETHGPIVALGLVGLVAMWRIPDSSLKRIALIYLSFAMAVYACYAVYLPTGDWWSLRFLFPAFPIFFIFIVAGGLAIANRLGTGWSTVAIVLMVAVLTMHVMSFSRSRGVLQPENELRYAIVGRHINEQLPPKAVFFAMLHSGSVRYYSGRLTVRYDWILAENFAATVDHLRERGYIPFLLIDDAEEADFKSRFANSPAVQPLSRKPYARFPLVSLYRL